VGEGVNERGAGACRYGGGVRRRSYLLQGELRQYTRFIIEKAWPKQRKGIVPIGGAETALANDLLTFKPQDRSEEIIFAEALHEFNAFLEVQRERLANVTTGIPAVLWWVVGLGADPTSSWSGCFDMEIHVHLILGGVLASFLGTVIFLIAALDNPFRAEASVGPDAFQLVYDNLMKADEEKEPSVSDNKRPLVLPRSC
jgi:hypothetical protein